MVRPAWNPINGEKLGSPLRAPWDLWVARLNSQGNRLAVGGGNPLPAGIPEGGYGNSGGISLWDMSATDESLERLKLLAEASSGHRLDLATQTLIPIPVEELAPLLRRAKQSSRQTDDRNLER
jgi:hypothetical protein